ncbi:MAG: HAD-IA family hydrolase [Nanoarchaeota archaeon]|nr:HAD-IA family hydrolase [Nanoarchaeota archaeon]
MTIDTLIFDLDGMLVDSQPAALRAAREALATYNVNVTDDEIRKQFGGGTRKYLWDFMENALGEEQAGIYIDEAVVLKNNLQQRYTGDTVLLPHAKNLLQQLKNDGYKLGLATMSARGVVDSIMKHHGIDGYFDVIVTVDDVINPKPDPEILIKTSERLGSDISRTLYAGDSANDLEAAAQIGMSFVLGDTGIYVHGEERNNLRITAEERGYPIVGFENLMTIGKIVNNS